MSEGRKIVVCAPGEGRVVEGEGRVCKIVLHCGVGMGRHMVSGAAL